MATCPICNETLDAGAAACPRCGFNLVGKTQAFTPVVTETVEEEVTVPVLKVVKGPYNGQEFVMSEGTFTIGRDPSCDLFLNNMTVSRLHSRIIIDGKNAKIVDEGSLNGTWVDGHIVDESPLVNGSALQIGTFETVFERKHA